MFGLIYFCLDKCNCAKEAYYYNKFSLNLDARDSKSRIIALDVGNEQDNLQIPSSSNMISANAK